MGAKIWRSADRGFEVSKQNSEFLIFIMGGYDR
jgi:hypothetical protein